MIAPPPRAINTFRSFFERSYSGRTTRLHVLTCTHHAGTCSQGLIDTACTLPPKSTTAFLVQLVATKSATNVLQGSVRSILKTFDSRIVGCDSAGKRIPRLGMSRPRKTKGWARLLSTSRPRGATAIAAAGDTRAFAPRACRFGRSGVRTTPLVGQPTALGSGDRRTPSTTTWALREVEGGASGTSDLGFRSCRFALPATGVRREESCGR